MIGTRSSPTENGGKRHQWGNIVAEDADNHLIFNRKGELIISVSREYEMINQFPPDIGRPELQSSINDNVSGNGYVFTKTAELSWFEKLISKLKNGDQTEPRHKVICHCYGLDGKFVWSSESLRFESKIWLLVVFSILLAASSCSLRRNRTEK